MLPDRYRWILCEFEPEGNPELLLEVAGQLETDGNLEGAAAVLDRAYGIDPKRADVRRQRAAVLDRLAVVEHGLCFRYIPAGPFLMGNNQGELDEQPWHPVWLAPFWLAETPLTWTDHARLLGWSPPPSSFPPQEAENQPEGFDRNLFFIQEASKIRRQYSLEGPEGASRFNWRSLPPEGRFDTKPLVAISWFEAGRLGQILTGRQVRYQLPTEAQWEKAARGGLIGARHAWGDAPPSAANCDFGNFREFSIRPSKTFPPNGYGLYAMNGGVWEWTRDWYDRDSYRTAPDTDPEGPSEGEEQVLRGGSWADCAEVQTVSYRMSRSPGTDGPGWNGMTPNVGFRLCRTVLGTNG
jgi:sulfatase modifying factor 1